MTTAESHSRAVSLPSKHQTPSPEIDTLNLLQASAPRALRSFSTFRSFTIKALALTAISAAALLAPPLSHASAPLPPELTLPAPGILGSAHKVPAKGPKYELKLYHLHTGESLDVVYRIGNVYLPGAMDKLNHFLRDHRTQDTAHYDPKEFDLLHTLMARLGKANQEIDVICGYRTPWSNNYLRTAGGTASAASTGVAQHSQHMLSKAIDIRVPGVTTSRLRNVALSLHDGGVGYYPVSQFVHVDVGPVRQWTFSGGGDD